MDFRRLGEPRHLDFAREVRAFLAEHWSEERRHRAYADGEEHDPEFLRALGARGWVLADWPAELGGAGLDRDAFIILDAELTAARTPGLDVDMTRMVAPTVRDLGSPELRAEVLPRLAAGETGICLGYSEPESGSDLATVRTRARRDEDGDGWVIDGTKVFTTHAHVFDYCFLLTSTDPEQSAHRGSTMFLLPLGSDGVQVDPIHTLGERTNIVLMSDVQVPDRYRIGEVNGGWTVLSGPLAAEHGTGSSGRPMLDPALVYTRDLAHALDAVLDWARTPDASGVAPGDDPLVRARLGEAVVSIAAGSATWGTSGRVAGSDALITGIADLVDLVSAAPEPVREAVDDVHRSAQVSGIYGGTVEIFKNLIGREMGLPRPPRPPRPS